MINDIKEEMSLRFGLSLTSRQIEDFMKQDDLNVFNRGLISPTIEYFANYIFKKIIGMNFPNAYHSHRYRFTFLQRLKESYKDSEYEVDINRYIIKN